LQLDIVNQNYVSPENLDKQMAVTEIIAADFSSHGDWLSTVEMWDDKVMSPEMRLYSTSLSTIVLVVLTTVNFGGCGGSVISAGTIHDLRRVKVPGTGPL
jgi:hypothetical protein